jgi:hypothetical protein
MLGGSLDSFNDSPHVTLVRWFDHLTDSPLVTFGGSFSAGPTPRSFRSADRMMRAQLFLRFARWFSQRQPDGSLDALG